MQVASLEQKLKQAEGRIHLLRSVLFAFALYCACVCVLVPVCKQNQKVAVSMCDVD